MTAPGKAGRACYDPAMSGLTEHPEPPQGEWWSDEPEMESTRHLMQLVALISTLRWLWRDRKNYFVAGNLTVYYSADQYTKRDLLGPDFRVVKDVDGRDRRSWMVWREGGRYPDLVVELLSDSTENVDRGEKMRVYQDIWRLPEYFLFDPWTGQLDGFSLVAGHYERIIPDAHGRLRSQQLDLSFGVLDGELRYYTPDGALVPKPDEAAAAAEAEVARLRAEIERLRSGG